MKRIFLVSMFIIANVFLISCTADTVETTPNNIKQQISADDTGGQIPIPPPKQ